MAAHFPSNREPCLATLKKSGYSNIESIKRRIGKVFSHTRKRFEESSFGTTKTTKLHFIVLLSYGFALTETFIYLAIVCLFAFGAEIASVFYVLCVESSRRFHYRFADKMLFILPTFCATTGNGKAHEKEFFMLAFCANCLFRMPCKIINNGWMTWVGLEGGWGGAWQGFEVLF